MLKAGSKPAGSRGSRKNRIGVSIELELEQDLKRLSISCNNMTPTTMAYVLLKKCLSDSQTILDVQKLYNTNPEYWVVPTTAPNGKRRLVLKR